MGRCEQKERERKRAAASCHMLDRFMSSKKPKQDETSCSESTSLESDTDKAKDQSPAESTLVASAPSTSGELSVCGDDLVHRPQETSTKVDIGEIFSRSKTPKEFSEAMKTLTLSQKYDLLTSPREQHKEQVFSTQYLAGCNRSFRLDWLSQHPWMMYSDHVDGVFCMACAIFCSDSSRTKFVTRPFRKWNKKSEKVKEHECSPHHQKVMEQADNLKRVVEHPHTTISAQIDSRKAVNIERNRDILKSIARAVLFCGKQCIALRGDNEDLNTPGNPGNFLALLKLLAVHDSVLKSHLESPAMRCVTHLSPQTQNELIEVMGKHIILKGILNDLNAAPYYSILADEVTSHNEEHLAICARFVDEKKDVREEFLTFIKLERITGEKIAESILAFLKENNIPATNMRGQGYDGASNMSSSTVGVQARIKKEAPLATYVHCNGHCLNLVISKSCALPQVRNVLDRLKNCCRFFLKSPKRSGLLELIVKHNVVNETKRKPLLDLCKTRWAERHTAYQHFYQAFVFIAEALEMIGFKRHLDKYGDMYADWDPANRNEAQQILASITSFEFIVVFMAVYQYLSHLAGITVKLQRAALDIVEAHGMITEVASFYRKQREDCDKTFSAVYTQSVAMAEKVGTAAEMPRITSRQQHRSNTEAQNPKIYFQRNVAIPLLDHIIMCINEQFSPSATVAASLLGLVPSVLCSKNVNLEAAVNKYNDDLPSPEMFEMELMRWRRRYLAMEPELRPASPAVAIKDCDDDLFPNISILLKIACTIPVTSCECERSASTLRRLNNYMRASMGKERLSNLALLHIHYDTPVELDTVVNCYAHLHPRRLQLENVLQ